MIYHRGTSLGKQHTGLLINVIAQSRICYVQGIT